MDSLTRHEKRGKFLLLGGRAVTQYEEEITGDPQSGFRRNRSTTDHIFCIRQILEKNGNKKKQLFIDFKKVYDSVRREVLFNIIIAFGIPRKLARLIKILMAG